MLVSGFVKTKGAGVSIGEVVKRRLDEVLHTGQALHDYSAGIGDHQALGGGVSDRNLIGGKRSRIAFGTVENAVQNGRF